MPARLFLDRFEAEVANIRAVWETALASEASGQRGHSMGARAGHSPEPGTAACTALAEPLASNGRKRRKS
jgi:hypothetical protein